MTIQVSPCSQKKLSRVGAVSLATTVSIACVLALAVVQTEARAQVQPAAPKGQPVAKPGGAANAIRVADDGQGLKPPKTSKWLNENTWNSQASKLAPTPSYKSVAPQNRLEAVGSGTAARTSAEPTESAIDRVYRSIQRERCREAQAATTEALKNNSNLFAQDNPTIFLNFNCQ